MPARSIRRLHQAQRITPVTTDGDPGRIAALLLLADGRLPTGGHAHSGGIEEAVGAGRVRDLRTLHSFLVGRLATAGEVDADFAAAAQRWVGAGADLDRGRRLDAELAARTPSPARRRAARAQGRGLVRSAMRCWPSAPAGAVAQLHPEGPFWPMALGAAACAAGVTARGAALVARWAAVTGPAWSAVRLLGLDPMGVAAELAELTADLDELRSPAAALDGARSPAADLDELRSPVLGSDLSAAGSPLTDIGAEHHAGWEVRLFAS